MPRRSSLKHRLWSPDGDPGAIAWTIASVSLVLPVVGAGLCLYGGARIFVGGSNGWWLLGAGALILVADIVIDFVWAHPGVSISDQPDLNRRGHQLAGRIVTVVEAIEGGRGKVRIGDTVWMAEGPDMAVGAEARVISGAATVLAVEPFAENRAEG